MAKQKDIDKKPTQRRTRRKSAHSLLGSASANKRYCVINLQPEGNDQQYSVEYVDEPPSGGFNISKYKTTKVALRLIDPGTFMMCEKYETTISQPYYIGMFEVTQKQYEIVTKRNPSPYLDEEMPVDHVSWKMLRGDPATYNWPTETNVDPSTFIGKMQAKTGLKIDLPTDAQWEYACRAGTTTTYSFGNSIDGDYCWHYGNSYLDDDPVYGHFGYVDDEDQQQVENPRPVGLNTHPVGTKLPNSWELYDMHGNIWEWCLDWYGNLENGIVDPKGPSSGLYRVLRGGSQMSFARWLGADVRHNDYPDFKSSPYGYYGFRLAITIG